MWTLDPIDFADLPGWQDDDLLAALTAFGRQCLKPKDEHYRVGQLGLDPNWFEPLITAANRDEAFKNPKHFFEDNFAAWKLIHSDQMRGQVTGFYEPEMRASLSKTGKFQTPVLRRPDDLIAINDENRPSGMDLTYRFGRKCADGKITAYFDRGEINAGAIQNPSIIAYLEDPVEAFFIHIQGAAKLKLDDGSMIRITYDGKSGHPFTAIGKLLVERGEIDREHISMQSIKSWLHANADEAGALMEENRSYIFFKEADLSEPKLGPIAAAKIPLTAQRSLAVDRLIHTFSTPIFVNADRINNRSFNQLMIAQETGTAIVGAARGDIFFGSGYVAGERAGGVNSPCDFTILVPQDAPFDGSKVQIQ